MKQRSDIGILFRMLKELGALAFVMVLTILCGISGYLAAASIPVIITVAAFGLIEPGISLPLESALLLVVAAALLRGFLRYAEQLSGHYIAFKILASLREKVFGHLRILTPAKLDGREKGELVSVITADIELLETFYAHTVAPVIIALLTSTVFVVALMNIHWLFGVIGAIFYILLGVVVLLVIKKMSAKSGAEYRKEMGRSGAFFLDSLRGLRETLIFGAAKNRAADIDASSSRLANAGKRLKRNEGLAYAISSLAVTAALLSIVSTGYGLVQNGSVNIAGLVIAAVLLASSFGPVLALSSLSTTLASTVASARRLFSLLDEQPVVDEVCGEADVAAADAEYREVGFSYPQRREAILKKFSVVVKEKSVTGFMGASGSGKSTALKLLMRFYDADTGSVFIGGEDVKTTPTSALRSSQTFISQDTVLFKDTLENNIRMGDNSMPMDAVMIAAKKAAIHDFITAQPQGYQTNAGELGERLSSGERQRIALARAFLRDSRMLLLDEPTSNLDVLNEAEILRSLKNYCCGKTVILVSHRKSTMAICERIVGFGS